MREKEGDMRETEGEAERKPPAFDLLCLFGKQRGVCEIWGSVQVLISFNEARVLKVTGHHKQTGKISLWNKGCMFESQAAQHVVS